MPPVTLEPPLPPLRRRIDQQGSFEATESQETVPDQHQEERIVLDLEAPTLGPIETLTTDLLAPFIVPVQFH